MFDSAYLKLTGWYVAIIMTISLLFSVWVYSQASQEVRVGLNRIIQIEPFVDSTTGGYRTFIDDRIADSHQRLIMRLIALNTVIFVVGAGASYWLAQRTLRPIRESVEAQHRFTADASHELRTPLAAMKSEIEVGLRDKSLSKADAVELLRSNLEEIDRLGNLAEGLLALTQADTPLDLQPVALEEVAARVAKRLKPLADAKKIIIDSRLEPAAVSGEDAALDKITGILLDNAIKYSPANTTVTLHTYSKDGHGYLEVKDQGAGIKASELPHLFERFYRADNSRSKQQVPGNGLGLSIAQKLAEDLDAQITVKSRLQQGSVFILKLPAA